MLFAPTTALGFEHPLVRKPLPLLDGWRVVVVDHDYDSRSLLIHTVRGAGASVLLAPDAQAAVELCLRLRRADLLIVSEHGEGLDGASLVRRLHAAMPTQAFLYIVCPMATDAKMAEPLPRDVPTLRQPFSPNVLLRAVRRALERRRAA